MKVSVFMLLLLICSGTVFGVDTWSIAVGGARSESGVIVRETSDGGFVAAGVARTGGVFVARLDSVGQIIWVKKLPGGSVLGLLAGKSRYLLHLQEALVQIDAEGNVVWSKSYRQNQLLTSPIQTKTGYLFMLEDFRKAIYLVSIDGKGNIRWVKRFSTPGCRGKREQPEILVKAADGVLLALNSECTSSLRLVKFSSTGNIQWEKAIEMFPYTVTESFTRTSDGGYILGIDVYSDKYSSLFIKIDNAGNLQWQKMYWDYSRLHPNSLRSIYERPGGYVVLRKDGIFELDSTGEILTALAPRFTTQSSESGSLFDLYPTKDGGYITTGSLKRPGINFGSDLWFLKLNEFLEAPSASCIHTRPVMFPNPSTVQLKAINVIPLTKTDVSLSARNFELVSKNFTGIVASCGN
jgi:hypothetical protein